MLSLVFAALVALALAGAASAARLDGADHGGRLFSTELTGDEEVDTITGEVGVGDPDGSGTATINDFGTGYSSLSYLERFPVDYVKIDRSFVAGLDRDPGTEMLVSAVIRLANNLNLKTIAEGVQTEQQLDRLRGMGCDLAQGYLFSEPLTAEVVADLFCTG